MRHEAAAGEQPESTDVTVSEIACYAYCAKAWHLEHVQRAVASGDVIRRREQGVAAHEAHGASVRALGQPSRTWIVAFALLLVGVLALVGTLLLP